MEEGRSVLIVSATVPQGRITDRIKRETGLNTSTHLPLFSDCGHDVSGCLKLLLHDFPEMMDSTLDSWTKIDPSLIISLVRHFVTVMRPVTKERTFSQIKAAFRGSR